MTKKTFGHKPHHAGTSKNPDTFPHRPQDMMPNVPPGMLPGGQAVMPPDGQTAPMPTPGTPLPAGV